MKKRYDLLRVLCALGKVGSVIAIAVGVVALLTRGAIGSPLESLTYIGLGVSGYISSELVLVIVAIESHTRATAIMLRNQERRLTPDIDEEDEPDYELT